MNRRTTPLLLAIAIHCAGTALARQASPAPARHVTWSVNSCMGCHKSGEAADLATRVSRPCRTLCATCHEFRETHHPVGVAISRAVPAPLLLTKEGRNTCSTCHDMTLPQVESVAWVSQSLFERLSRRSRENLTYHLVMKNDRGQLCRNCH
ncbi:MAG: hypothetical protein IPP07_18130 [Holophagales bacterium]|nr:hypothetical protein [Holophagales bacterium]MBK9966687.1 hypothetical protein [Holophagales bacterium]